jgi:hypothetical protein
MDDDATCTRFGHLSAHGQDDPGRIRRHRVLLHHATGDFGIAVNDNDSSPGSGNNATVHLDSEIEGWRIFGKSGTNGRSVPRADRTMPHMAQRFYLRIDRRNLSYYTYWSSDGATWFPFDALTVGAPLTNIWIYTAASDNPPAPAVIVGIDWLRIGTINIDPDFEYTGIPDPEPPPLTGPAFATTGHFWKKADGTGEQSITGLGFQPKAIILYCTAVIEADLVKHVQRSISTYGMATGVDEQYAIGSSSRQPTGTHASRRMEAAIAVLMDPTTSAPSDVASRAVLASIDEDGFTLDWTTNDSNAWLIMYLAIGGDGVDAEAVLWNIGEGTGLLSVDTLDFQPELLMSMAIGDQSGALPIAATWDVATTSIVHAGAQFVNWRRYTYVSGTGSVAAYDSQHTDAMYLVRNQSSITARAVLESLNEDGWTVNKTTLDSAEQNAKIVTLAIRGIPFATQMIAGIGEVGEQAITGLGFQPSAIMLTGWQRATPDGDTTNIVRVFGFGSAGAQAGMYTQQLHNTVSNHRGNRGASDEHIVISAPPGSDHTGQISQLASLASIDEDGFTLDWSVSTAVPYFYALAFANYEPPEGPSTPDNLSAEATSHSRIVATWDAVDGALSYDVRWSDDGDDWTMVEDVSSPYAITGLVAETEYTVQVRAVNADGVSDWSAGVKATTLEPPEPGTASTSSASIAIGIRI